MARTDRTQVTQALLEALACGATMETAARKAGVSERTAYRRLTEPAFCQRLSQLRAEMVERTAAMLTGAGVGSVKTLVDLQGDVSVPAPVRPRAARGVLELGLKLRAATQLERRPAALQTPLARAL